MEIDLESFSGSDSLSDVSELELAVLESLSIPIPPFSLSVELFADDAILVVGSKLFLNDERS